MRLRMFYVFWVMLYVLNAEAANTVTTDITRNEQGKELGLSILDVSHISNVSGFTEIGFGIKSIGTPFEIYRVEWINCDSTLYPLVPFSMVVASVEVAAKEITWYIRIEFDYKDRFSPDDIIRLYTDKGVFALPTSMEGKYKRDMSRLYTELEQQVKEAEADTGRVWGILVVVLSSVVIAVVIVAVVVRRKFIRKRNQLEEMSMLMVDRNERNRELEYKVDDLYRSRLETFYMLCNEYFEKSDSEKVRLTLYREVEKQILSLRDKKSVEELEGVVNTYLDDIMVKVRSQLPALNVADLRFLVYLFAGFSPRAVCIFTDIKIKNFYNRRSRLKERILASDAPDREWFVSKM